MKNITVIDYGMSNLHSVIKSFQKVSDKRYKVCVATTNEDLEKASMIVLPGQGAAKIVSSPVMEVCMWTCAWA